MKKLNAFLSRPVPKVTKCVTCKNREVSEACREFAAKLESGDVKMPWSYFWREFLQKELGFKVRYMTFMGHVKRCM